jgi:hypothetical protein
MEGKVRIPKRQTVPSAPQPQRPVTEREPLTITVIEPAVQRDTAVRVPRRAVRIARHIELPRVAGWYWLLAGLAAMLLLTQVQLVTQYVRRHRLLPAPIVRIEHALQRHIIGGPVK